MRSFSLFGVALALLLNSCASTPEIQGCGYEQDDHGNSEILAAKEAVRTHVRAEMPSSVFALEDYYMFANDGGDVWRISFQPRDLLLGECATGGSPEFSVNKKTLLVRYERWSM